MNKWSPKEVTIARIEELIIKPLYKDALPLDLSSNKELIIKKIYLKLKVEIKIKSIFLKVVII